MTTTTTTSTAPAEPAKRYAVNNPLREVIRIIGVVDGMLHRGSYACAVDEFLVGFDRLEPMQANALHEWLTIAVESAVLTITMLEDEDAIEIPLKLLSAFHPMYLGAYGSDIGFTRLLLRSADSLRLDNDVYAALLLFSITVTKGAES